MGNGVFWIGQDGKTYMRGEGDPQAYQWTAPLTTPQQRGYTQIQDPVNPPSAPAGGGGGTTKPELNQAAVDNTQRALDQLPAILKAALDAETQTYHNAISGFDAQEGQQRKTYDASTTTNQQNYDANFMDSIRAGIKGLGGLMALLRGTGAAGGSVEGDVRDVVGGTTANDIRSGADTQKQNQGQLDSSLSQFLTNLGLKRKQNEDTFVNNQRSIRHDNLTQMQDLLGKMAGFYSDAGMKDQATSFMNRAGDLTPEIAQNSRSQVSKYDQTPVVVHAPNLTAFAEPTQPTVVTAPPDGQVGSGIFTMTRKKSDQTQVPALAGA